MLPFIISIPSDKKLTYRFIINIKHYLLWLPLFLYIGYKGAKLESYWWALLLLLGISVISIHGFLFLNKMGVVEI
jgi:hypothetical protein